MSVQEANRILKEPGTELPDGEAETGGKGGKGKKKKDKSGKSNLVPAIVIAVGLVIGGYFVGSGGNGAATEVVVTVPEVALGPLVEVDSITLNLADGHYLRLGVSFQMNDSYQDAIEDEEMYVFPSADASKVRDALISIFGGNDYQTLSRADGRESAREELLTKSNDLLSGNVLAVFFTDFVIQ